MKTDRTALYIIDYIELQNLIYLCLKIKLHFELLLRYLLD